MEQQIQDLISTIKKDGIEQAKAESDKIINDAKKTSSEIIKAANAEKERILSEAQKQIEIERNSSLATIKQAARDVSLSLKKDIEAKFNAILEQALNKELKGDVLAKCIESVIKSESVGSDVYVELSKSDFNDLKDNLAVIFSSEIAKGLEFKVSPTLSSGFRIVQKDGEAHIDLSSESCTELLMPYLSDSLKGII